MIPTVSGIVLAGGESRRMGRDKALLCIDGQTLLERSVGVLNEVCAEVVVVGRVPDMQHASVRHVQDGHGPAGPLRGLLAGLKAVRNEAALVVACDMPALSAAPMRLLVRLSEGYDAVIPTLDGQAQSTHALYRRTCIEAIESAMRAGNPALRDVAGKVRTRWVDEHEMGEVCNPRIALLNVNSAEEWSAFVNGHDGVTGPNQSWPLPQ